MDTFTPVVNAYRFYQDGTESGSSPMANQDIDPPDVDVDGGDVQFQLRYRVDETGSGDGAATDDYALEYQVGAGGWNPVTGASSVIQADTGSSLTDGGATTDRATNGISNPGAGSFVAGEQEAANGVIEDVQLTLDNFTEHVWGCQVIAADVSNGDAITFRMTLNGGSPGITNSVTPGFGIAKTPPAATPRTRTVVTGL